MDDDAQIGSAAPPPPPVVVVVVVHQPGTWFEASLDALAAQDYGNLRALFVLTAPTPGLAEHIQTVLPLAHVRELGSNPGFGAAANEVLGLVEGDAGLLLFLHDDVALEPDAVRILVEELRRSHAGIVGPKLVEWDRPRILQDVGQRADRFGQIAGVVEPDEADQEQHDAVRDVFCLPSACLMVQAGLFRSLGGFEPEIEYYGDSLDLCWRAHLSGARVMVVPGARARHRRALRERRADVSSQTDAARAGLETALALSGASRAVVTACVTPFVAVAVMVAGLFNGTAARGVAMLRAYGSALVRTGVIVARRRKVRPLRLVPDGEVAGLQARGSVLLGTLLRRRHHEEVPRDRTRAARQPLRRAGAAAWSVWLAVLAVFAFGSRSIIGRRMPAVGNFLTLPHSGTALWRLYGSGWWPSGFGHGEAAPTAVGLLAGVDALSLGHPGLARLVLVLGPIVAGYVGIYHFSAVFADRRARLGALVAYAVNPLPYAALASGHWAPVTVYGALPWALELLRRSTGIQAASNVVDADGAEVTDAIAVVGPAHQVRLLATLGLLEAVVAAFVPAFVLLVLVVALAWVVATVAVRGTSAVVGALGTATAAGVVAFVLNLPWSLRFVATGGWTDLVGAGRSMTGLGLSRLARFAVGPVALGSLSYLLVVPLVVGVVLARGWRLTWLARAGALVITFGALAVAADRGAALPDSAVLLVPAAAGLAIGAAGAISAFGGDVQRMRIGWRQPVGLATFAALGVASVALVADVGSGRWQTPQAELAGTLGALPVNPASGNYRILFLGDARLMPLPAQHYRDGISYAVAEDGTLDVLSQWAPRPGAADALVVQALDAIRTGSTVRAGNLLAPLGIRFIVVPLIDGVVSTRSHPLAAPAGLEDAMSDQIDLRRASYVSDQALVFDNVDAIAVRSLLTGPVAAASRTAGAEALAAADYTGASAVMIGQRPPSTAHAVVGAGTFYDAVGRDPRWTLAAGNSTVAARPAFGWATAYDLSTPGPVTLRYATSGLRGVEVWAQLVAWTAVGVAALRRRRRTWRWRRQPEASEPSEILIHLDDAPGVQG